MQDKSRQPRVFVAVASDCVELMRELLGDAYDLVWAKTVSQAQSILSQETVDLILCSARFDDSRLLDLLQYCKASKALASIPFLCLRVRRGKLPLETLRDLVLASSALGAAGFVDFDQWQRNFGLEQAAQEFHALLSQLMAPPA
jgi:hypothetical protein